MLLTASRAFCLDSSEYASSIASAFSSLTDRNAGSSSFRSLYIPSGGRAEAMGTAFTALANDIGFFEYNPAASATMDLTQYSVFHNSWIADSSLESIAYTRRLSNLGYGAMLKCFYVPFTEYDAFGEKVSAGYYSESTAILNISYNFFSSYGFKGLAAGLNLKGAYRCMPDYADNSSGTTVKGSGAAQSAVAAMADVGLQMRFNVLKLFTSRTPNFFVGAALSNIGFAVTGSGTSARTDEALPSRLALGVAWQVLSPVFITLEFQQPVNLLSISATEQWSAATGLLVKATDFFALEAGFLLRGAQPRLSLGAEFDVLDYKMNINYTLDLTSSLHPLNHISLSAKLNLGDEGRLSRQKRIDELYIEGLMLYKEGSFDEAARTWRKILVIDSSFTPAEEAARIAEKAADQQRQIISIQSLD